MIWIFHCLFDICVSFRFVFFAFRNDDEKKIEKQGHCFYASLNSE
jgi:hypothetical protein